jgi:ATP-dependent Lon protease
MACMLSRAMQNSNEERYEVLKEDSKAKRAELIEKMLYEFMEVGRIANEAATSQQQEVQKRYKEAAIKL